MHESAIFSIQETEQMCGEFMAFQFELAVFTPIFILTCDCVFMCH